MVAGDPFYSAYMGGIYYKTLLSFDKFNNICSVLEDISESIVALVTEKGNSVMCMPHS